MKIKYKKLVPEAKTPFKKFDVDAGFDLYATAVEITSDYIQYRTGIAFEIPDGYVGLVFPRSSVSKYDLMLKNAVGVIDASYRNEILCRFTDLKQFVSKNKKHFEIGERVVQIVFFKLPQITLIEADELNKTQRGSGGFGHTGK